MSTNREETGKAGAAAFRESLVLWSRTRDQESLDVLLFTIGLTNAPTWLSSMVESMAANLEIPENDRKMALMRFERFVTNGRQTDLDAATSLVRKALSFASSTPSPTFEPTPSPTFEPTSNPFSSSIEPSTQKVETKHRLPWEDDSNAVGNDALEPRKASDEHGIKRFAIRLVPSRTIVHKAVCACLFACLCIQGTWVARRHVVAAVPWSASVFQTACDGLGCEPFPFEPDSFSIEDSSVHLVLRKSGLMRVEASVKNNAPWPQRTPWMTIEVRDGDGSKRRALLPSSTAAGKTLMPGEEADLVAFVKFKGDAGDYRIRVARPEGL